MIPSDLKAGIDDLLDGVSRNDLAARSAAISKTYRAQGISEKAIRSHSDGLAYLITRLPATYAAVSAALHQIALAMPDFTPSSLLDAGAGTGSATWAAKVIWDSIIDINLFDENPHLLNLGKMLAPEWKWTIGALQSTTLPKADLVIASYALGEIKDSNTILDRLWQATGGVLVIVEPGTPAGYENIVRWRTSLLEKDADICAPCPHDLPCPIVPPDWCHFSARLPRSRDHQFLKSAKVPFEDEKFSYLAATKRPVTNRPQARILTPAVVAKAGISCKLCQEGRIDKAIALKRDHDRYKSMARKNWGDGI